MERQWQCSAAYAYVMHLTPALTAWEYLRRNPDYMRDWMRCRRRRTVTGAARWGLAVLIDPHRDAREALPVWDLGETPSVTLVQSESPQPGGPATTEQFSIWNVSARKCLFQWDEALCFEATYKAWDLCVRLDHRLSDRDSIAYQPTPLRGNDTVLTAIAVWRSLLNGWSTKKEALSARPNRANVFHARALQAFDGFSARASQRNIAVGLFGMTDVTREWHSDAATRGRVRYLIHKARAFTSGEYRSLITADARD